MPLDTLRSAMALADHLRSCAFYSALAWICVSAKMCSEISIEVRLGRTLHNLLDGCRGKGGGAACASIAIVFMNLKWCIRYTPSSPCADSAEISGSAFNYKSVCAAPPDKVTAPANRRPG